MTTYRFDCFSVGNVELMIFHRLLEIFAMVFYSYSCGEYSRVRFN